MKNIFNSIIFLSVIASYSQTQTIPLRTLDIPRGAKNYYLKDTFNDFNQYVGTWKYENPLSNTSLLIKFKKVIKFYDDDTNYIDHLAGEYLYIENNVEIVNTLANLNTQLDPYYNNIGGYLITYGSTRAHPCFECPNNVMRIKLSFNDPEREYVSGGMHMWHKTEADGTEKIMIDLYYDGLGLRFWEHQNDPTTLRVPYGKYTLTRVLE